MWRERDPWETTRLIGGGCTHGNMFSRSILIGQIKYLFKVGSLRRPQIQHDSLHLLVNKNKYKMYRIELKGAKAQKHKGSQV